MPLDEFQKTILRTLSTLRSPDSVFAGGAVLPQHGHRLSADQDIFHSEVADIMAIAHCDGEALSAAGLDVTVSRRYEGLVEAIVGHEDHGYTKIQWVQSGSWNFFAPVVDPAFGYRLHMADIAVNKVLAAGGRRAARDYVDLVLIHRHIMPLWHAIWAAPGKDESWSPLTLAEQIARTNAFRQVEFDEDVLSTRDVSASEIGSVVREATDEAGNVLESLPRDLAGRLFVDGEGNLVNDLDRVVANEDTRVLEAKRGGTWPSGPDIDRLLIRAVVETFGWEGSRGWTP